MKCILAVGLMLLIAAPAVADIIIDSFDQGPHEAHHTGAGGAQISTYTGVGPIGGERKIRALNMFPFGGQQSRVTVDTVAPGTCEFWGTDSNAQRSINWGQTNSPDASCSVQLNADLTNALAFEIDFVSLSSVSPLSAGIYLRCNYGEGGQDDFLVLLDWSLPPGPQTVSIPIGDFGMTAADLADVDGVRMYWNSADLSVMSEFRFTGAAPPIPEPSGLGVLALGAAGVLGLRRKRF